ncbi:MAG: putative Ig domain-containing protein, partial [Planctomycetaceae bacterium]
MALAFMVLQACKFVDSSNDGEHGWSGAGGNGSPPIIWGEPPTNALVNSAYDFAPEADDPDGDIMEFSIANKPAWAGFDPATGRLQGVPDGTHVGAAEGIVISVTDRHSVVLLPAFSILVRQEPLQGGGRPGGGGDNGSGGNGAGGGGGSADDGDTSAPPSIFGKPNKSAVIDTTYAFQPDATDPDGDELSFSIVNKPLWAGFDTTTGRLEGSPAMSDLG